MTLRIMLVGLVASLGLELPSGPEVSCWTQSSRDWVQARLADLSGPEAEASRPCLGSTDCLQADESELVDLIADAEDASVTDDSAFLAVSEAMAAEFAAELVTIQDDSTPSDEAPEMLASEAPTVGIPDGEECPVDVVPVVEVVSVEIVASDDLPAEESIEADELPTRADRVASAIRLTQEAVQAWADLIPESSDESSPTR